MKVVENQVELDIDIASFTAKLASYNQEALVQINNLGRNRCWDTLLLESGDFRWSTV
jgi:methylglutaconyl-CoA hydratase